MILSVLSSIKIFLTIINTKFFLNVLAIKQKKKKKKKAKRGALFIFLQPRSSHSQSHSHSHSPETTKWH